MPLITRKRFVTVIQVLVVAAIILLNMAIFKGNASSDIVSIANQVEMTTEEPTATAIPTATAENHVEHVMQLRFDKRSENVRKICTVRGAESAEVTKPVELIDVPSIGLLWCPTLKAGSENLVDLFCKANFNHEISDSCNISTLRTNNPANEFLSINAKNFEYSQLMREELGAPFMTVRNPISRFFSSYRDHYEMAVSFYYYVNRGGEEIVKRYRNTGQQHSDEEKELLLRQARDVIEARKEGTWVNKDFHNPYLNPPGPTFREFVKWAVNGGMDATIMPYYQSCAPCAIDYSILRMEKLNEESGYLFSVIERSYLNLDFRMSLNSNSKTDQCQEVYYRTIPRHELQALFTELFMVDCDLYSYPCREIISEIEAAGRIASDFVQC